MLPFDGGREMPIAELAELVLTAARHEGVEGITLLGGEPLAHAPAAAALANLVCTHGLSVMVFSGYTLEEARELPGPDVSELLALTDILVDGRYDRDRPDTTRRWIGSTNQRIHFMTDRYRADDPCWRQRNTLEIRLVDGELSINGFPAPAAVGLWKHLASRA
jgi:anaerobic ribonucleoside-triphosphate reductase activating protein